MNIPLAFGICSWFAHFMSATFHDDLRIPPKPLRITLSASPRVARWPVLSFAALSGLALGLVAAGLLAG